MALMLHQRLIVTLLWLKAVCGPLKLANQDKETGFDTRSVAKDFYRKHPGLLFNHLPLR
ncbi:hypothetical protein [Ferrimonas balearica]|uniref:hypothetical protein n=1 Tax=Ferrimonas balearica TaxID=44012 RepID=UPI001494635F|nr:hypothetical protein [Ferrimonas balearica]